MHDLFLKSCTLFSAINSNLDRDRQLIKIITLFCIFSMIRMNEKYNEIPKLLLRCADLFHVSFLIAIAFFGTLLGGLNF
jgi:hypothetical protein